MTKEVRDRERAERCYEAARTSLGNGWKHVSEHVRWGLVCAEIVAMVEAQDESVGDAARVRMLSSLVDNTRRLMELRG